MINTIRDKIALYKAEKSDEGRDQVLDRLFVLWNKMKKDEKNSADSYLNACIYILLVNRDIFHLYNLFYFEKKNSKKNFYGRLLSMTIIEYLEDVNDLIGHQMVQEIKTNNWNDELVLELRKINKAYSKIKKDFEKQLRVVRNNASAHKTKDSKKLYEFTKVKFDYLNLICPLLRFIEIDFENVSMKFDQLTD